MATEVLKSYNSLQEQLAKAKNQLSSLNDNIKRIVGHGHGGTSQKDSISRKRSFNDSSRPNNSRSEGADRQRNRDFSPPATKKRSQEPKSVFSRLSGPTRNEETKQRMHSRVIRELPSRQEVVNAQGGDEQSRARNRRMFGSLLGTLQKFCQEESRLKQKEDIKAKIEKKLEDQELQERENLKKERQSLFINKKLQQLQIRKLEITMNRLKEFEVWENSKRYLFKFIRTKTKPYIYYLPKTMNSRIEKRLASSQASLNNEIEKRRSHLNAEIEDIERRFRLRETEIENAIFHNELPKHKQHIRHNETDNFDDDDEGVYGNSDEENYTKKATIKIEPADSGTEDVAGESRNSQERLLSSVVVSQSRDNGSSQISKD